MAVAKFCDAVFATAVATRKGLLTIIYWERNATYGTPLMLLDWSSEPLSPLSWSFAQEKLLGLAVDRRARYGSIGAFVEGEELAQQAAAHGLPSQMVPDYLTTPDYWPRLGVVASGRIRDKLVRIIPEALAKTEQYKFLPLSYSGEARDEDDPSVPAFLYGIVLALDESAARDPKLDAVGQFAAALKFTTKVK